MTVAKTNATTMAVMIKMMDDRREDSPRPCLHSTHDWLHRKVVVAFEGSGVTIDMVRRIGVIASLGLEYSVSGSC